MSNFRLCLAALVLSAGAMGCVVVAETTPVDTDGDGIPDSSDACPTVKGVATSNPATNGCPADRDGDGINDAADACPDVAGPAATDPNANGCPSSAVETRTVSAPAGPAIDAHYDWVFPSISCELGTEWRIATSTGKDSGSNPCYDSTYSRPWLVRFDSLSSRTYYDLTATVNQGGNCYEVKCWAITTTGATAVIPTCEAPYSRGC